MAYHPGLGILAFDVYGEPYGLIVNRFFNWSLAIALPALYALVPALIFALCPKVQSSPTRHLEPSDEKKVTVPEASTGDGDGATV